MGSRMAKRDDGRYQVSITYEDGSGVKRRKVVYGRTQEAVKKKAEEARESIATGAPVRDDRRLVSEWLEEWRRTTLAGSDRAPSTRDLYAHLTKKHVEPVVGKVQLGKLRPVDVTRVFLKMGEAGLAASTVRNTYAALRAAMDDAVTNGILATNPVLKVKRPKAVREEAVALTPQQVTPFLAGAADLRYVGALRFILGTGLRRGEALALRWADVDLERGDAQVRGSLVRRDGALVVSTPKTAGSRRTVALSAPVVKMLKAHKKAQDAERKKAANLWSETGYVFATETGGPVDPRNLLRAVVIAAGKVGLADVGVHTLRHTYATAALLGGVPIHVVSRNLGHTSITVTADIYGHLTDAASRSAADVVAAALGL